MSDENGATPHPPARFGSKKFCKKIFAQTHRQPAPPLGWMHLKGFALCASICKNLQKVSASPRLTLCLTSCFKKDLFAFRLDLYGQVNGMGLRYLISMKSDGARVVGDLAKLEHIAKLCAKGSMQPMMKPSPYSINWCDFAPLFV
ncbi:hypothetical protein ACP6EW_20950 [Hafnia paralvei]|uniref:hypothetical protein n=1 Tax=Hafnia paralvei TaxID=546367 RepID=UPI003CF83720